MKCYINWNLIALIIFMYIIFSGLLNPVWQDIKSLENKLTIGIV